MQSAYLVLGATGAIGGELLTKLSGSDHEVIAIARDQTLLNELDITEKYQLDATDYHATQDLFAQLVQQYQIIGVAHCVGSIMLKPAAMLKPEEWQATINVNLNSAFNVVASVTKHVKQDASTVLFSSAAASIGLSNHEAIAAAKAGVEGLTRSAAASYATKNLRFNAIAPGLSEAKISKPLFENQRALDVSKKLHPLGRLGKPEKLASLAAWLLDPENDWITGEVIHCDGGLSTVKLPN